MKTTLVTSVLIFLTLFGFAQSVQRSFVVLEIGTGTWCTYCPGAARAADDLVNNGKQVAVIEYHNGDAYVNNASNARNSYYGITGYPTGNFDGVTPYVGGQACPNGNVYSAYLPLYNAAYAVQSPLTIDIAGTNSGNNYDITLSVHRVNTITATDLKVHLALTESHIVTAAWPPSGLCMTEVNFVERLMVPDENGTSLSFSTGDWQFINLSFTKDPSWNAAQCELVAFVQSNGAKTIYNGMKTALNSLPVPMVVDFTGTPTSGCAPLTTSFTGTATGASNWQWSFPGGNPASSTIQNPSVIYSATGTYDVTLTAWNSTTGRGNKKVKTGYITATATPAAPGMPQGLAGMCVNPPDQTYTTTGSSGATGYSWDLSPAAAGILTPSGTSCTVNFNDTWTGVASLKVQASNACGTGPWSPALQITVSTQPSQPGTPAGADQLCIDSPNTDYTTSGATPVTSYVWELLPYEAGALYPVGSTCTIDWISTYTGTASLRVKALNGSCESSWSGYLYITVNPLPTAYPVTGGGPYCGLGGNGSPVGLDNSETGVNYTLYLDGSATANTVAGTGSPISFGNQMTAGVYTVQAVHVAAGCQNNMNGSATVTIDPELPYIPGDPAGPEHVYTGATPTTDYATSGGQYATSYSWDISPAAAGTIAGNTTTGTVTWDQTYSGLAEIKVQGTNSCGSGSYSDILEVTVDVGVGLTEPLADPTIRIYPNPAKNSVIIVSTKTGNADVMIYNFVGEKVLQPDNVDFPGTYQVDISTLSPGIYLVKVKQESREENVKLIIE